LILGHHPHVPQLVENFKGSIIAYSLGNFIFDMDSEMTNKSFALSVTINNKQIIESHIIPFEIHDYCPCILSGKAKTDFIDRINELNSIPFKEQSSDLELKLVERKQYTNIYKQNYIDFFRNIIKINPWYSMSLIFRAILRRMGFIYNP